SSRRYNVRAYLILAQVVDANRRNHLDSQKLCCFNPTMARNDLVIAVNQYRIVESELDDRTSDLVLLLLRMNARVARIGFERRNYALFDTQRSGLRSACFRLRPRKGPPSALEFGHSCTALV